MEHVRSDPPVHELPAPLLEHPASLREFLPEEIVAFNVRWISTKQLHSGDIAVKAVRYNPEVVLAVRTVARTHHSRCRPPVLMHGKKSGLRAACGVHVRNFRFAARVRTAHNRNNMYKEERK